MNPINPLPASGLCPQRLQRIHNFIEEKVSSGKLPGAVTLIERNGESVYRDVQGWRNIEQNLPMAEDSIFRIYSMTKIVTSVALLMVYEEGGLDLNDKVGLHIPSFEKHGMTIYDLLRHCGGLDQKHKLEALLASDHTLESFCDELAALPLAAEPDTKWIYGYSTDVLARIIEVVSGQSFDVFLQDRIFEPLGMNDTGFTLREDQAERFTVCYQYHQDGTLTVQDPSGPESRFRREDPYLSGSAGLLSSAADYMSFCRMLLNKGHYPGGTLLGRKTVDLMTADHLPKGHPNLEIGIQSFRFGLGVSVMTEPHRSRSLACKGDFGWGGAAGTQIWISPEENMIVMIMIQVRADVPTGIMDHVKRLAYQALV
ncbi:serine hydrolase [Kiritimatiellaeota bacterium B1221]|nr:serine hydrolase [Kiritimatiellaeota bacterium B1221]